MAGSYIKLQRRLMRSEVYRSAPVVRELFIWLLMNCGWQNSNEERRVDITGVGRGQWKGTLDDIRKGLSWKSGFRTEYYTKAQIQRALVKLNGMNSVEYMGDTKGIALKVCKIDTYKGSRDDGRNTSETLVKRLRNVPENVKDISYNIYNKDISYKKDKEIEEGKEELDFDQFSSSNNHDILKIVEPVFGNLADPFYGLGGLNKWGGIVAMSIQTYTLESVKQACELLVTLHEAGEAEVYNPEVFFKKGIPGYIVRAKNEAIELEKIKEKKKWTGYCTHCDHQKIFNEQPKNYVYCEQCDEMYYQSKMYYDYEKQDDINNS